jgi:hypothetical protein
MLKEERKKLGLLCLLLFLMLCLLAFMMVRTVQEVRNFQQQNKAVKAKDVSTIRSWMTVPVVSHVYEVPEDYLYRELNVHNTSATRHATLNVLANTTHRPVDQVIKTLQRAIIHYRQAPPSFQPTLPLLNGYQYGYQYLPPTSLYYRREKGDE